MKLLKILTIGLLIQGLLLSGSVQAQMIFDSVAPENMSPSLFIQNKALQTAFKRQISLEQGYILRELVKNNWSLEKTEVSLGIGRKKINKLVGKDVIEQGKKEKRLKEIETEKEMVISALQAYRWNVALAAKETGIWTKRIRELIPIQMIQRNRVIAEEQLKELMIKVLADNEWNVVAALQDKRLVDQEIGKHLLYTTLTVEWISAQRNVYREKIENQQREDIIAAIKIFMHERNCLEQARVYLKLAKGTFNERIAKYRIKLDEIKYSRERVLSVLIETEGNPTLTAGKLGLNEDAIGRIFSKEINQIKNSLEIVWLLNKFEMIDKNFEAILQKISKTDPKDKQKIMSLCLVVDFIKYRFLLVVKEMQKKANEYNYPIELREMIVSYEKCLNAIDKVLADKPNDPKLAAVLLKIVAIEIKGTYNKRIDKYAAEQFILMHGNSLLESAQAEISINNSI